MPQKPGDYTWVIEVTKIINPSGVVPTIQITQLNSTFNYESHIQMNLSVGTNTLTYNLTATKNVIFSLFLNYENENIDVVSFSSMTIGGNEVPIAYQPEPPPTGAKAINTTLWHHQTLLPTGTSWYNNEIQHYTNRIQNSYIYNNKLYIVAIQEIFNDQNITKYYTSARLNSKKAFLYGTVEIKAKLPIKNGTWPAFWTLGQNILETGGYWNNSFGTTPWPDCGEIDIMEHLGSNPNYVSSSIHTPSSFGATVNTFETYLSSVKDYHIYKMKWDEEKIQFYVDHHNFYTYQPPSRNDDTWPFKKHQYLLLNLAVLPESTFQKQEIVIDYVRIYDTNNNIIFQDEFTEEPEPEKKKNSLLTWRW